MPDKIGLSDDWINASIRSGLKTGMRLENSMEAVATSETPIDDMTDAEINRMGQRGRMIAEEAIHIINGERQDQYGSPEDTFQLIADLWAAYLGNPAIQAAQVADMMILLKIAREAGGKGKKDNYVDLLGYAMLGARMRGYDA